jgi:hypothetical protein
MVNNYFIASRDIRNYCFVLLIFSCFQSRGQEKKWDGEAGDSAWLNPLNWSDNQVPVSSDSILLDNSIFTSDYAVVLPSGVTQISIHHISISPSGEHQIKFILPSSNTAIPALSTIGKGGLKLFENAFFENASGASSGTPIAISDSIYIFQGGKFLQKTATAHASIIACLSRNPLTAEGCFEFDVPGHASYTVSITGRTYGNLRFSANAAGGSKTYLSSGASASKIRGNFLLSQGVIYNLNYSGTITVEGNLAIDGTLNLSTGSLNPTLVLKGDLAVVGSLQESGSGLPVVEFSGNRQQSLSVSGAIRNSITCKLNNESGLTLQSPVNWPYRIQLQKGSIYSTWGELLTLGENAWIEADTASGISYVQGPLRKTGMKGITRFCFPVGSDKAMRWFSIKDAFGDLTVEYRAVPATSVSGVLEQGLYRVSQKEYWKLRVDSSLLASLELSFRSPYSGSISDFGSLTVALNSSGIWRNLGHVSNTGSISSAGSVTSSMLEGFDTGFQYCSLAGELMSENLLPLHSVRLNGIFSNGLLSLNWTSSDLSAIDCWELQSAELASSFTTVYKTCLVGDRLWKGSWNAQTSFFRVKGITKDGSNCYSNVFKLVGINSTKKTALTKFGYGFGSIHLEMIAEKSTLLEFRLLNPMGQVVYREVKFLPSGFSSQSLNVQALSGGVYILNCIGPDGVLFSKSFVH